MNIFVIGSRHSERIEQFHHFAQSRACGVHRLEPGESSIDQGRSGNGVVLFNDDEPGWTDFLARVRDQTRYLNLPLLAVAADSSHEEKQRLQAAGAMVVFRPDTSDADIFQEIENRCDSSPVDPALREALLEPFICAAGLALREMAGTEVAVRAVYQKALPRTLGDISAVLGLVGASTGTLVLSFPERTATAVAQRVLAGAVEDVEPDLVRDCMGEIANVLAGQAKALLFGTPYHFVFSTPTVVAGPHHEVRTRNSLSCLVVVFATDLGNFALQICLNLPERAPAC